VQARGIHHLGVAVEDLDQAVTTYERIFGARLEHRETVLDQGVEAALLRVGDGRVVQIYDVLAAGLDLPTFTKPWPIHGIDKFWLRITNACGTWDSASFFATNSQTRRRTAPH